MSTLLRGLTLIENEPKIYSDTLTIEIKPSKNDKARFQVEITDRDFADLKGQFADTVAFLEKNKISLQQVKNRLSDLSWHIDFGYMSKLVTGSIAIEAIFLPLPLLKLCSELEIELLVSMYDSRLFQR